MGFAAVALIAEGVVTAATVTAAVAEVGVALAVVGAVTGDKNLVQAGSMMAVAGGISNWAVGGELFGAAASEAGAAESGWGAAADQADQEALQALSGQSAEGAAAAAPTDAMANNAPAVAPAGEAAPSGIISSEVTPSVPAPSSGQMPIEADPTGTQQTITQNLSGADTAAQQVQSVGEQFDPTKVNGNDLPADYQMQGGATATAAGKQNSTGFFSSLWNGMGDKTRAATLQLAGGAMSGANQAEMWNQKMEMENRRTDLHQQRLQQTSYGNEIAVYRRA